MKNKLNISLLINLLLILLLVFLIFSTKVKKQFCKKIIKEELIYKKTSYNNHYKNRNEIFNIMPLDTVSIIFIGNSITEGIDWNELFKNIHIKNRGIGSDNSQGILKRINSIIKNKPKKIFLMVGINDIFQKLPKSKFEKNMHTIIESIKINSPKTKIYIQSILPTYNQDINKKIIQYNKFLKELSVLTKCKYINLYPRYLNNNHCIEDSLTYDGVHLNSRGYLTWKNILTEYIYD